jgi:hypothetical protein
MADSEDNDTEFVKRAAVEVATIVAESRRTVLDEHSHLFRWLTASLLALNGGAAVAMLSSETFDAATKLNSCACFVVGIVFALLVGVGGQRANMRVMPKLNDQLGYWLAVSHDGERVLEREQELDAELKKAQRVGIAVRACGWFSALAFLFGTAAIGVDLRHSSAAKIAEMPVIEGPAKVPEASRD